MSEDEEATGSEEIADEGDEEARKEAPMADLARRVSEGQEPPDLDEEFEEVETPEIDADEVWADLEEGTDDEPVTTGERVDAAISGDVRVIPKRTCHTCPYFGAPPELHCTHEGTEIRSVVSPDEFEVVDCPMVVDDEDLGASR
jgi:hypothetical protein